MDQITWNLSVVLPLGVIMWSLAFFSTKAFLDPRSSVYNSIYPEGASEFDDDIQACIENTKSTNDAIMKVLREAREPAVRLKQGRYTGDADESLEQRECDIEKITSLLA